MLKKTGQSSIQVNLALLFLNASLFVRSRLQASCYFVVSSSVVMPKHLHNQIHISLQINFLFISPLYYS